MKWMIVAADERLMQELQVVLQRNGCDGDSTVQHLEAGSSEEMLARVHALFNAQQKVETDCVEMGEFTLQLSRKMVWRAGKPLELTPKEFVILSRLMLAKGEAVQRDTLLKDIYQWATEPATNTLEVHIHNLREKIGKAYIKTLRGVGYRFIVSGK